jgi:basic membrane protein A
MKFKAKKLIACALAVVMMTSVALTGCGKNADTSTPAGSTAASGKTAASMGKGIALICSAAGANDNGYNQSAISGLKQLKDEAGIDYKVVEATTDYPGALKTLAEADYKLIFSLEYDFTALINGVGGEKPLAEQFPNTTFVVFNANPNLNEDRTPKFKNVISAMFNVNEASFLAGALSVKVNENAATLFDSSKYNFKTGAEGRKIGFIGGTKSAGIEVFSNGFAEGINYAAKEVGNDVIYTYYSTFDAGFTDTAQGATTAATYYNSGANIVFTVAGSVGDGVDSKAKELKKLSIEVDANKDKAQPGHILTSVIKNTNVPVVELGKLFKGGELAAQGGKEIDYTLASGATSITDLSTIAASIKTDAAAQAKWKEIVAYVNQVNEKIKDGTIKVTNAQVGETTDMTSLSNLKLPK